MRSTAEPVTRRLAPDRRARLRRRAGGTLSEAAPEVVTVAVVPGASASVVARRTTPLQAGEAAPVDKTDAHNVPPVNDSGSGTRKMRMRDIGTRTAPARLR